MNTGGYNTYFIKDNQALDYFIKFINSDIPKLTGNWIYGAGCFNTYWNTVIKDEHVNNFAFGFLYLPLWYKDWIEFLNSKLTDMQIEIITERPRHYIYSSSYNSIAFANKEECDTELNTIYEGFSACFKVNFSDEYKSENPLEDFRIKQLTLYAIHHMVIMVSATESWINVSDLDHRPKDILSLVIRLNNGSQDYTRKLAEIELTPEFFEHININSIRLVAKLDYNSVVKQTSFMCGMKLGGLPKKTIKNIIKYATLYRNKQGAFSAYIGKPRDKFLGTYLVNFSNYIVCYVFENITRTPKIAGLNVGEISITPRGLLQTKVYDYIVKNGFELEIEENKVTVAYSLFNVSKQNKKSILKSLTNIGSIYELSAKLIEEMVEYDLDSSTKVKQDSSMLVAIRHSHIGSLSYHRNYKGFSFFNDGSEERISLFTLLLTLEQTLSKNNKEN